ncbi:MAG: hypothetical protein DRP63_04985 [Planctomycetota bacterium]|nr:MAG: hypothetical protein DRP63_04985 [Planctomycetota bacterium]
MARPYKVLLQGYEEEARSRLRESLGELLGVEAGHADDILASVPIVLFDNLSKKEAEKVVEKMKKATENGAEIVSTRERLTDVARIEWPELPQVVKEVLSAEEEEKKETAEKKAEQKPKKKRKRKKAAKEDLDAASKKEKVVVSKYDFTVDQIEVENKWVFCCPRCGALFQLVALGEEERQEALAQREIEKMLEKREATLSRGAADTENADSETPEQLDESPAAEEEPLAVPLAEEPEVKNGLSVTMDEFERYAEEVHAQRTEDEQPPAVEPTTPPEELPVVEKVTNGAETAPLPEESEGEPEGKEEGIVEEEASVIERLQMLPQQEQPAVLRQPEAPPVEEVPPEEVLKLLNARKKRATALERQHAEKLRKALAAKRRARAVAPPTTVPHKKTPTTPKSSEPKKGVGDGTGKCAVVLPTIRIQSDPDKLNAAAEILAQLTGVEVDNARDALRSKPIIPIVRGVSKEKAKEIQQFFTSMGITVRIVEPRTKPHT